MPIVQIEGHPDIEFPDSMSNDEIKEVLRKKFPKNTNENLQNPNLIQKGIMKLAEKSANSPISSKILDYGANNPLTNFILGAGDVPSHFPFQIAQLLGKNTEEFTTPSGNGISYSLGKIAGDIGTLGGLGKLLKPVESALNLSKIPKSLARTSAVASYGAINNPENRLLGAIEYGLPYGAFEAAPLLRSIKPSKFGKIKEAFNPGKLRENLIQTLSHGSKNTEQISESIANDLRKAYKKKFGSAIGKLEEVIENTKNDKSIFEKYDPLAKLLKNSEKEFHDLIEKYGLNKGLVYKKFSKNPTFENAHNLQSNIGLEIRTLTKKGKGTEGYEKISDMQEIKNLLKENMENFLQKKGNDNLKKYREFSKEYAENVNPYEQSKKIRNIVKDGKTIEKNIHKAFEYPADIITKSGKLKKGNINKILEDLPPETRDKILFSAIKGYKNVGDSKKLVQSVRSALNEGYSKYAPKNIEEILKAIEKKQFRKDIIQSFIPRNLSSGTTGALIGSLGTNIYNNLGK